MLEKSEVEKRCVQSWLCIEHKVFSGEKCVTFIQRSVFKVSFTEEMEVSAFLRVQLVFSLQCLQLLCHNMGKLLFIVSRLKYYKCVQSQFK